MNSTVKASISPLVDFMFALLDSISTRSSLTQRSTLLRNA
ncbi:hypothetical protein M3J09_012151 [Ascochyta lentis]